MPETVRLIRVFVSSPGDVQAERDVLDEVVASINRTEGEAHGVRLELFKWEENVTPQIGPKPQQVVDAQTPAYDIYLGIPSWVTSSSSCRRLPVSRAPSWNSDFGGPSH